MEFLNSNKFVINTENEVDFNFMTRLKNVSYRQKIR